MTASHGGMLATGAYLTGAPKEVKELCTKFAFVTRCVSFLRKSMISLQTPQTLYFLTLYSNTTVDSSRIHQRAIRVLDSILSA